MNMSMAEQNAYKGGFAIREAMFFYIEILPATSCETVSSFENIGLWCPV